jgi:hypothetical protein
MPPKRDHEEEKVHKALDLLKNNPGISRREAYHEVHIAYSRVTRRLKGIPSSSIRGRHNKKLQGPQSKALKDHIFICYIIGRSISIDIVVVSINLIL